MLERVGTKLKLSCNGRTVDAVLVNKNIEDRTLLVAFESIIDDCPILMPLYQDDNGIYRNWVTNHQVKLEWLKPSTYSPADT